MGPILICDKSTLQALSRDELAALRRYYSLNIPPVLLAEILSNLKKHSDPQAGQNEVRILANKVLPARSTVNVNYRDIIAGELLEQQFPMDGRPVIEGGRQIDSGDGKKTGLYFKVSTEEEALLRWQAGAFHEGEMFVAEAWRRSARAIDLEGMKRQLRNACSNKLSLNSFDEVIRFVEELMHSSSPNYLLRWFLTDIGMFGPGERGSLQKFYDAPTGSLHEILPYTAHCVRTSLIFHFALAFGLVSTRSTNRIDLEYFYYVPFSNAFSSGDNFHREMAPYIIKRGCYVPRDELKSDLNDLAKWWAGLTPELQEIHLSIPPENDKSITHRLWQKIMRPGYKAKARTFLTPEKSAEMLRKFQEIAKKAPADSRMFTGSMDDCDFIMVQHFVRTDGPCICGSAKLFKECCGHKLVKSREEIEREI
ncbi:MAG TPA: SEC-C domain-containing protein [Verrucomicrobiae bacterium]|jgi:hypothetical protein